MKIILHRKDYEAILRQAYLNSPLEACGLIAGTDREDGIREIRKVYFLDNTDRSCEHFSIDPKQQIQAVKDMRNCHLKPLGNWHSHPASPSRPSEEDKRLAYDSHASYLILSIEDRNHPVLHSFHIESDNVRRTSVVNQIPEGENNSDAIQKAAVQEELVLES